MEKQAATNFGATMMARESVDAPSSKDNYPPNCNNRNNKGHNRGGDDNGSSIGRGGD